jgi:2-polyprenyl-3-methyl-5-hydroxy-6-metoxy-1,4-benzoquinol methylase
MRLIEIGASYHPIVPKSAGWQTTVVDHADREELAKKYRNLGIDVEPIEPVDIIWREGTISDAFPADQFGRFDGLIASHVAEHIPDLIGFLQAADRLLKPDGVIALALPDKRAMFDFFAP